MPLRLTEEGKVSGDGAPKLRSLVHFRVGERSQIERGLAVSAVYSLYTEYPVRIWSLRENGVQPCDFSCIARSRSNAQGLEEHETLWVHSRATNSILQLQLAGIAPQA